MYDIVITARFRKAFKKVKRRGYNMKELRYVVGILKDGYSLPAKYRDHALSGKYAGYRECHIAPDWLLVYRKDGNLLILTLTDTGTHADIFGL